MSNFWHRPDNRFVLDRLQDKMIRHPFLAPRSSGGLSSSLVERRPRLFIRPQNGISCGECATEESSYNNLQVIATREELIFFTDTKMLVGKYMHIEESLA